MSTRTARGARSAAQGILADDRSEQRENIIAALKKAYWMEIETVTNHVANSVNPDEVLTEGVDPVTNDMGIAILRDEEGHRRLFEGYLREYEAEGLA